MNMEKEAQRRSLIKGLGRKLNPMEHIRYHGSETYREVSDAITDIDNEMRAKAKENKTEIRDALHQARMAMKNREYPKVMFYTWKVVEAMNGLFDRIPELLKLRTDMISRHYQNTPGGLTENELSQMDQALGKKPTSAQLQTLLRTTAAPEPDSLISEAGPVQWLKENIPTYKQMEGSLLDRIFRNKMGKQKESARSALRIAESVYNSIPNLFSQLDSHRTDFSAYLDTAQRYQQRLEAYQQNMSNLYQEHFSQTVNEMMTEDKPAETPVASTETPAPARPTDDEILNEVIEEQDEPVVYPAPEQENPPNIPDLETDLEATPPQMPLASAAANVVSLVNRAKKAYAEGEKGIASALLVKASEICDEHNAVTQSINLIKAAERVLKG